VHDIALFFIIRIVRSMTDATNADPEGNANKQRRRYQ